MSRDADELVELSREVTRRLQAMTLESARGPHDVAGDAMSEPVCDLIETADAYFLAVDLPGVAVEDVEIRVRDGRLHIKATRRSEDSNGCHAVQVERTPVALGRSVTLPEPVDEQSIEAGLDGGVLTVRVAKRGAPDSPHPGE